MRHTDPTGKRDALTSIMNQTYDAIRALEMEYGLCIGDTDYRPRIEYFHDAVRILSQQPELMYLPRTRLSVEHLAYDLGCLRYLQERPLARLNHGKPVPKMPSLPSNVMQLAPPQGSLTEHVGEQKPLPPTLRGVLAEHYRSYAVMFAALFAESANTNFQTRVAENDTGVEDIAQVEHMIRMVEQGMAPPEKVEEVIRTIENPQLRDQLIALLHDKAIKRKEKMNALRMMARQQIHGLDMDSKAMDKAHMSFLTGQMLMFQDAKDLVRKLSSQGLALAGQFLENAVAQAAGRGTGRGV